VDGAIAVEKAGNSRFDAILMDMQMPRMSGLEAARLIRLLPGCGEIPILAMTGNAFDEDRRRCLEAGMDDFIAKPFTPRQLTETLARWLIQPGR
jgi:CheY-like chemotaxis protein